jgi:ankyrin repeat protein
MAKLRCIEHRGTEEINCGADVDVQANSGYTALRYAAALCQAEFTRILLEHGAMVDRRDPRGRTLLHCAASNGQTEVVRFLLECGTNTHVRDKYGNTPSELGKGHHEIVELLSDCDALSVKK